MSLITYHDNSSYFVRHEPCPSCGSRDNLARYSSGTAHCFGCGYYERVEGEVLAQKGKNMSKELLLTGTVKPLKQRHLTQETCAFWGYQIGDYQGKTCQIASYRDAQGKVIAQKLRFSDKSFKFIGDCSKAGLFGQHLWRNDLPKIIVVEGEIDALSVSQIQGHKWPVVSLPNGASSARRSLEKHLDWLEGFKEIILMFDQDEAGQQAVSDCVDLFTPGKVKIASLPLKDANEMLVSGRGEDLLKTIWNAKLYRPDGIVNAKDLWQTIADHDFKSGADYPYSGLNLYLHGLRPQEIVTFCAGTNVGKSQLCREIAYKLLSDGHKVGYMALEEGNARSLFGFMGLHLNRPFEHFIDETKDIPEKDLKSSFDACFGHGRLFLDDHWGSIGDKRLLEKIRFLAKGCGCDYIILDHISISFSGSAEGDERRYIDRLMTNLRSLTQETNICLLVVSHLRRVDSKSHEDGGKISLSHLRGSNSIAQLSDAVIGVERDLQSETSLTGVRILKNRLTGRCGLACELSYNPDTGRLLEHTSSQTVSQSTRDAHILSDF